LLTHLDLPCLKLESAGLLERGRAAAAVVLERGRAAAVAALERGRAAGGGAANCCCVAGERAAGGGAANCCYITGERKHDVLGFLMGLGLAWAAQGTKSTDLVSDVND
jgi:hypothetical protein